MSQTIDVDYSWESDSSTTFGWAIDFVKAVGDRPWYMKLILRIALGKYAFNEFIGLRNHLRKHHYADDGYELENMEYHKEPKGIFWWTDAIKD